MQSAQNAHRHAIIGDEQPVRPLSQIEKALGGLVSAVFKVVGVDHQIRVVGKSRSGDRAEISIEAVLGWAVELSLGPVANSDAIRPGIPI
jgi:hypothetical protein